MSGYADTSYDLTGPVTFEQGYQSGTFGIVNRSNTAVIRIKLEATRGTIDDVLLHNNGDSVSFELEGVRRITISSEDAAGADLYPATILLLNTNLAVALAAAPNISTPSNPVYVTFVRPAVSTTTVVPFSLLDGEILAANANRYGGTITNESDGTLYLLLGNGVSSLALGDHSVVLGPMIGTVPYYYEIPFGYIGRIGGIWDGATAGGASVDELTP